MKPFLIYFILILFFPMSFCKPESKNKEIPDNPVEVNRAVSAGIVIDTGMTILTRFTPPEGFSRDTQATNSFASYLRNLPLKPAGTKVYLFDGSEKSRQNVHEAVVNIETGKRDLQQCADAVMRLRAEYLFAEGNYDMLHFNFTNGFEASYSKWREGNRIVVNGNQVTWRQISKESTSYNSFLKYMDMVFAYAGTLSLSLEMRSVPVDEMKIGDVFIQGGSPGHAVIVVDMAVNHDTGKKLFLLAQSYMPAQDIHVLRNTRNEKLSPWYALDVGETLQTPEWTFRKSELKRFQ